jgi:hypothetical protein
MHLLAQKHLSRTFDKEAREEEDAVDRTGIAFFEARGFADAEHRLLVAGFEADRRREAEGRTRGCRLLKKLEHVVAVGEVVAAHEIEQPAFALVETVDRGRLLAKPEQARRQVARPTFGNAELFQEFLMRETGMHLSRNTEGN